jgi:hypothetical protein
MERGKALRRREEIMAAKVGRFSPATQSRDEGTGRFAATNKPLSIDGQRDEPPGKGEGRGRREERGEPRGKPASHRKLSGQTGIPSRTVDANIKAVTFLKHYSTLSKVENRKGKKDLRRVISLGELRDEKKLEDDVRPDTASRVNPLTFFLIDRPVMNLSVKEGTCR